MFERERAGGGVEEEGMMREIEGEDGNTVASETKRAHAFFSRKVDSPAPSASIYMPEFRGVGVFCSEAMRFVPRT